MQKFKFRSHGYNPVETETGESSTATAAACVDQANFAMELLVTLKDAGQLIDDMSKFVGQMALPDYQLFNDVPLKIRAAIAKATRK